MARALLSQSAYPRITDPIQTSSTSFLLATPQ
jgi:hypothetical protein